MVVSSLRAVGQTGEYGSCWLVRKKAEDMCKPAAATLRWRMLAPDLLGPPDVLNGSRSPAIIAVFLAAMVLFKGHVSEP